MRRAARALVAALVPLVAVFALTAHAQTGAEPPLAQVEVEIRVEPDGSLEVRETQRYDGPVPATLRRGFPARVRYDDDHDQVYDVAIVTAQINGAAVDVAREADGDVTQFVLDVGAAPPGETEVTLTYVVRGAVRATADGLELSWPVVTGMPEIGRVSVSVSAPAVRWAACFAGHPDSSIPCTATQIRDLAEPRFDQEGLPPGGRMTIIVGMPAGAGVEPDQMLVRRWSPARAFAVTPTSVGLALALAGLCGLGVVVLWLTRGRDRPAESAPSAEPPVLEPPDGVLPGQLGTVVNERVDVVDVAGTVLDLAVRGHLSIAQTEEEGHRIWRLHRGSADPAELHHYEQVVLDRLFSAHAHVALSQVAAQMREGLPAIRDSLYADVVAQGWFVERPDAARSQWATAGLVLALAGVVVTVVLAAFTDLGLVGLGLVAGGGILGWGGDVAPARAPRGTALLPRLHDFRQALATIDPAEVPPGVADRLLPFAVVFGVEDRWLGSVAASAVLPTELEEFVTTLAGVLAADRVRI